MTQNRDNGRQIPPAPTKGMSDFRKALLWTATPIIVLSVTSAGIAMGGTPSTPAELSAGIAGMLWGLAIPVCIGFAIARKRQIAVGILAGIGIGIVGLGLTCFTTLWY